MMTNEDFEVHQTGTHKALDEKDIEIARLKYEHDRQMKINVDRTNENERLWAVYEHAKHLLAGGGDEAVHHLEQAIAAVGDR